MRIATNSTAGKQLKKAYDAIRQLDLDGIYLPLEASLSVQSSIEPSELRGLVERVHHAESVAQEFLETKFADEEMSFKSQKILGSSSTIKDVISVSMEDSFHTLVSRLKDLKKWKKSRGLESLLQIRLGIFEVCDAFDKYSVLAEEEGVASRKKWLRLFEKERVRRSRIESIDSEFDGLLTQYQSTEWTKRGLAKLMKSVRNSIFSKGDIVHKCRKAGYHEGEFYAGRIYKDMREVYKNLENVLALRKEIVSASDNFGEERADVDRFKDVGSLYLRSLVNQYVACAKEHNKSIEEIESKEQYEKEIRFIEKSSEDARNALSSLTALYSQINYGVNVSHIKKIQSAKRLLKRDFSWIESPELDDALREYNLLASSLKDHVNSLFYEARNQADAKLKELKKKQLCVEEIKRLNVIYSALEKVDDVSDSLAELLELKKQFEPPERNSFERADILIDSEFVVFHDVLDALPITERMCRPYRVLMGKEDDFVTWKDRIACFKNYISDLDNITEDEEKYVIRVCKGLERAVQNGSLSFAARRGSISKDFVTEVVEEVASRVYSN